MRVISAIENEEVIRKIRLGQVLKHLGLWDKKVRPPSKATLEKGISYQTKPVF